MIATPAGATHDLIIDASLGTVHVSTKARGPEAAHEAAQELIAEKARELGGNAVVDFVAMIHHDHEYVRVFAAGTAVHSNDPEVVSAASGPAVPNQEAPKRKGRRGSRARG